MQVQRYAALISRLRDLGRAPYRRFRGTALCRLARSVGVHITAVYGISDDQMSCDSGGNTFAPESFLCDNKRPARTLAIPVHPIPQSVLDATPSDHLSFLTTRDGSPFSPAGFGNLFRDWCKEAGLPKGLSAHGLRKACCTRLAEAGCSAKQIAAISGHVSLSEVAREPCRIGSSQQVIRPTID